MGTWKSMLPSTARNFCSLVNHRCTCLENDMPIDLNHTIVHARDPRASANFLADILERPAPVRFGPFHAVALDNGVTLDFIQTDSPLIIEHYAFLVSEEEFDQIFG